MILVVGGSNQGKLDWTLKNFGLPPERVVDGNALTWPLLIENCVENGLVFNHLEVWLRRVMPEAETQDIQAALRRLPEDMVIICDSVGGGLVPVERFDRQWRELVGRVCCDLAAEASQVWRIFCGLPQRLK